MKIDLEHVLDFWFADAYYSSEVYRERCDIWFMQADETFDNSIRELFEPYIEPVFHGELNDFEFLPRAVMAMILILDQFPRNIYRGTAKAFAYDAEALRLARLAVDENFDESLEFIENLFLYLPLEHAEDLELQQLSVQKYRTLESLAGDDPILQNGAKQALEYAEMHRDIIARFGRFPHRNAVLKRESTPQEIEYLNSGAETFGQSVGSDDASCQSE